MQVQSCKNTVDIFLLTFLLVFAVCTHLAWKTEYSLIGSNKDCQEPSSFEEEKPLAKFEDSPFFYFSENISVNASGHPVDDLKERYDAEAKAEAKQASQRGNEVHRTHSDAPLQLLK